MRFERVIRTDLLFPAFEPIARSRYEASLSFLFQGGDWSHEFVRDRTWERVFSNSISLTETFSHDERFRLEFLQGFIPFALQNKRIDAINYRAVDRILAEARKFDSFVFEEVLRENLVIERSPPSWLPVGEIIKWGPVTGGGFVLGMLGSFEPILLVTVPTGIVLIGSAVAIAKAFDRGISRMIAERILGRRDREW
ncbi:hypothetical protein [Salinarimonas sp.]|uniref:hypothetical protein n=1 Tax=Salinarimonas sp. TaxID=2766526 RepID=UPI0032D9ABBF